MKVRILYDVENTNILELRKENPVRTYKFKKGEIYEFAGFSGGSVIVVNKKNRFDNVNESCVEVVEESEIVVHTGFQHGRQTYMDSEMVKEVKRITRNGKACIIIPIGTNGKAFGFGQANKIVAENICEKVEK